MKTTDAPALKQSRHLPDKSETEPIRNTKIVVVATNVTLTKAQAQKIAQMAHDGMARAIRPSHTMFDGDTIFAVSTKKVSFDKLPGWENIPVSINKIGSAAADTFSRAIVHGILAADSVEDCVKSYCDTYPDACANRR